ncbi:MAG: hypothetical protein OJF50_003799 [Nitrospira sp.]|nr:hypothetical protein [Nitrospira sp.]
MVLTACHIAKATIDTIIWFISGTSPDFRGRIACLERQGLLVKRRAGV